jgi:hypothetical protein
MGVPKGGYTLEQAQLVKQEMGRRMRSAHEQASVGVAPRTSLDRATSKALAEIIEERAPGVKRLNRETQKRIIAEQQAKRMERRTKTPEVLAEQERLRVERIKAGVPSPGAMRAAAEAKLRAPADESLIGLHTGFPFVHFRAPRNPWGAVEQLVGQPVVRGAAGTVPLAAAPGRAVLGLLNHPAMRDTLERILMEDELMGGGQ